MRRRDRAAPRQTARQAGSEEKRQMQRRVEKGEKRRRAKCIGNQPGVGALGMSANETKHVAHENLPLC